MFKRMPLLIMGLVAAMLVGLVGHGVELFYAVEGGGFYGLVKAMGFPLAFECGNAVGLYIGFNRQTKGAATRFVALLIGTACVITSYLIQFHYFDHRIEADWWYAGVLPGLVALLSALTGLLDRDLSLSQQTESLPSDELTAIEARMSEMQGSLQEMAAAVRIIQSEPQPQSNRLTEAQPQFAFEPQAQLESHWRKLEPQTQPAFSSIAGAGAADGGSTSEEEVASLFASVASNRAQVAPQAQPQTQVAPQAQPQTQVEPQAQPLEPQAPQWTQLDKEGKRKLVTELRQEGLNTGQIAARLSVSENTVRNAEK
ncbi:MAG: hypothetical protein HXX20_20740 [Chloroflexi bacterium]|nr:hypothetical protein [Chloroflexota bacterium]